MEPWPIPFDALLSLTAVLALVLPLNHNLGSYLETWKIMIENLCLAWRDLKDTQTNDIKLCTTSP